MSNMHKASNKLPELGDGFDKSLSKGEVTKHNSWFDRLIMDGNRTWLVYQKNSWDVILDKKGAGHVATFDSE